MVHDVLATKIGMTQAWTKDGKRVCVTRLHAADIMVVGDRKLPDYTVIELGVGQKKLKNTNKPQRSRLEKSGFLVAPRQVRGVRIQGDDVVPAVGSHMSVIDMLTVGDIVNVQGLSKGKGFAGVVKRHGFAGGPKTHGQSDRHRAPGSIGNRTTPGRVFKNKRMAGHMGVEVVSVQGLTVVYIDPAKFEVWVSGPVPGSYGSIVKLQKTGSSKGMTLDAQASGTREPQVEVTEPSEELEPAEKVESEEKTEPAEKVESEENAQSEEIAEPIVVESEAVAVDAKASDSTTSDTAESSADVNTTSETSESSPEESETVEK